MTPAEVEKLRQAVLDSTQVNHWEYIFAISFDGEEATPAQIETLQKLAKKYNIPYEQHTTGAD